MANKYLQLIDKTHKILIESNKTLQKLEPSIKNDDLVL